MRHLISYAAISINFSIKLRNCCICFGYKGIYFICCSHCTQLGFTSVAKVHIEADQIQAAETNDCVDDS